MQIKNYFHENLFYKTENHEFFKRKHVLIPFYGIEEFTKVLKKIKKITKVGKIE